VSIKDQISADMKQAMKARDAARLGTLRMIKAEIMKKETEPGNPVVDEAALTRLLLGMKKQREDAIALYRQGGRSDLVDKELAEIGFIDEYIPAQMGEAELAALVTEVSSALDASGMKDMGRVIKEIMARTAGSVDGKRVSSAVKAHLG